MLPMTPVGWARPLHWASTRGSPRAAACTQPLTVAHQPFSLVMTAARGALPALRWNSSTVRIISSGVRNCSLAAGAPTRDRESTVASGSISSKGVRYSGGMDSSFSSSIWPMAKEPPPPPPSRQPPSMAQRPA